MPYPSGAVGFPQPPVGSPHGHHPPVHPPGQYAQMQMRGPVPTAVHPSVPASFPAMAPYPAPMRTAAGFYEGPEVQAENV
eukprot:scaffold1748_cov258-Pinguiococcus_pyrenoidosus.AAC.2